MQCVSPIMLTKENMYVPCGRCTACRIARTRDWTVRMLHEIESWPFSVFVTLTYDDNNLPGDNSLIKSEFQLWIKRLRRMLKGNKIKYYGCGEYGEKHGRPHYHAIIYGLSVEDKPLFLETWNKGFVYVGNVSYNSARYVAGYIQKKYNGPMAKKVYGNRQVPFQLQSQGIGKEYALKNATRLRKELCVSVRGVKLGLPRYYKKVLDLDSEPFERMQRMHDNDLRVHYIQKGIPVNEWALHEEAVKKQRNETLIKKDELFNKSIM